MERLTKEAKILGLENDLNEPFVFTWRKNGKVVILIVYVDDMYSAGNDA